MKSTKYAVVFALMICSSSLLQAAETKRWKDTTEVSYVTTNGNSKGSTMNAKNIFGYKWSIIGLDIWGGALNTSSERRTTAEQYNAGEKVSWNFTERNYVFETAEWLKDRFAGIMNRYSYSGGLGRELISTEADKLNLELGAGYVEEKRTDESHNRFSSGRAYAKYVHTLSATSSFLQDAEFLSNFEDPDGYQSITNTALIASISTHMSLKLGYQWKFNNKPASGYCKSDTVTSATLLINY